MSHFIVVYKVTKKKVYISDPAKDIKTLTVDEFFKIYDGISILIKPSDTFSGEKVKQGSILTKFLKLLTPHKKLFIMAIISSLFLTVLGIVSNFFNQILIDEILPFNLKNQLTVFAIGFLVISVINIVLSFIRSHILLYLSQKIDIPLTLGYYKHIFSLPMKFFGTRKTGDILTRFQDAQTIKSVLSGIALSILIDITMVSITGVVLYFMNAKLFVIVLIATLINIA
ncbi:similar to bacteriocin transporter subunit, putative fragment [Alteracholeplasma palmae J233]|uniref:Similar to bacteriocin transporter subunit, putative n=1 Tax=Alteracholeplasma palmae (strain ATCC 49389 / J233) TaxID=1318466 RepID=U4KQW4_ALTPJ|nr:similar to bacteriocin transporter subunit, putative fragment [Alteracholeplasma palmae J233]